MRLNTRIVVVLFITIASLAACQQKADRKIIITTIDFNYLEGCETGNGACEPIEIFRQNSRDSIILVFPSGGTSSDVYLKSKDLKVNLHDQKTHAQGRPQINLTGLPDGEYYANMLSCALGGACKIQLKTKSP